MHIRRRRTALTSLAVLTLAATAACSGTASHSTATPNSPTGTGSGKTGYTLTASTGTPKGDIDSFAWSIYAEPPSLDYAQAFDYPPNQVLANVCESLMRWNPDLTTSPGLATAVSNPSPTSWVFDIRSGVKFHDGTTLTADDVVASLNRNLDPNVASVWGNSYRNVASIAKSGPLQVTVTLKTPDSTFAQYMAASPGHRRVRRHPRQGRQGTTATPARASTAPARSPSAVGRPASPSPSTGSTATGTRSSRRTPSR